MWCTTPRSLRVVMMLAVAAGMAIAGCTVSISDGSIDGGDDGGDDQTPTSTTIRIRIVNDTNRTLDPQVYVGPAGGTADGLFVAENQRTAFGVGNLGIMLAGSEATITLTCGESGFFGTLGGIFGSDLTAPDGTGRQVVLEEGTNVQCGDVVTLWFENDGDTLVTTYAVTLQSGE